MLHNCHCQICEGRVAQGRLRRRFCALNYKLRGLLHLYSKLLPLLLCSSNIVRICAAGRTLCITSGANTSALSLAINQPDTYISVYVVVYDCSVLALYLLFVSIYFEFIFAQFNLILLIYKYFLLIANA